MVHDTMRKPNHQGAEQADNITNPDRKEFKKTISNQEWAWNPNQRPTNIATLNVKGLNEASKRQSIEKWAD